MSKIAERREIRVEGDDADYVFEVEPDAGRLVIRQDAGDDVCEIRVDDSDQLVDFMEGLRRALAPFAPTIGNENARSTGAPVELPAKNEDDEVDRDEMIVRARNRNANAFRAWTPDEERAIADGARAGRSTADMAQELGRSQRAIEMRLAKLGMAPPAP